MSISSFSVDSFQLPASGDERPQTAVGTLVEVHWNPAAAVVEALDRAGVESDLVALVRRDRALSVLALRLANDEAAVGAVVKQRVRVADETVGMQRRGRSVPAAIARDASDAIRVEAPLVSDAGNGLAKP